MRRERNPLADGVRGARLPFLFAPIVVLVLFSFNDSADLRLARLHARLVPAALRERRPPRRAVVTFQVALVAVVISTVLGTLSGSGWPASSSAARVRRDAAPAADGHARDRHGPVAAAVLPPGCSTRTARSSSCRSPTSRSASRSWRSPSARGRRPEPALEEAARTSAHRRWAFRHVTLPLILPAVVAGAMLAFALSFDDYVVTTFNAGVGTTTLPLYIYSAIGFGVSPAINAISTIIVAITAIAIFLAWRASAAGRVDRRSSPSRPLRPPASSQQESGAAPVLTVDPSAEAIWRLGPGQTRFAASRST